MMNSRSRLFAMAVLVSAAAGCGGIDASDVPEQSGATGPGDQIESSASALSAETQTQALPALTEDEKAELVQALAEAEPSLPREAEVNAAYEEAEKQLEALPPEPAVHAAIPAGGFATTAAAQKPLSTYVKVAFLEDAIRAPLDKFMKNYRGNQTFHRGQYAWVNWWTDRCSFPTHWAVPSSYAIKKLMDAVWTNACIQHDLGYSNFEPVLKVSSMKKIPKWKTLTDSRFLDGMRWTCDKTFDRWFEAPAKVACRAAAVPVYEAVKRFAE